MERGIVSALAEPAQIAGYLVGIPCLRLRGSYLSLATLAFPLILTYGLALEDNGVDAMLHKVEVEPSGEAFNSISLHPVTGRPRRPPDSRPP